ncbi:MAG: macro domain-containing protein [Oscillospiraceae bacterium]|nr:macro domain-containing protein [Oscillospiraceae bacterium]
MPFVIVRNDITNMSVDAIVNTANPKPVIGSGTDSMIHEKSGPQLLLARQKLGAIAPGCAAATPAFDLQAKYVIHTVGPVWNGGSCGEEATLRSCYENSLKLAQEKNCQSIAFPLISAGNYGFPKDIALQTAISVFSDFLLKSEMMIYLVVFDRSAFRLSERLFQSVDSYIDEHYVAQRELITAQENIRRNFRPQRNVAVFEYSDTLCESAPCPTFSKDLCLEDALRKLDAGFTETLLKLIDQTGKKDSEIYKKANLSKQHFSKIRNNPNYHPTKPTAIALAIALELDLEQTNDLIGRAGYTLNNSSLFDVIVRYHIELGIYNVVQIDCVLFEHDQSLLSSYKVPSQLTK